MHSVLIIERFRNLVGVSADGDKKLLIISNRQYEYSWTISGQTITALEAEETAGSDTVREAGKHIDGFVYTK